MLAIAILMSVPMLYEICGDLDLLESVVVRVRDT